MTEESHEPERTREPINRGPGGPHLVVVTVLGRKLEPDGSASQDLINRVVEAQCVIDDLMTRGYTELRVVLSGGKLTFAQDANIDVKSEALVMKEILLKKSARLASEAIVLDENSTHTLENAVFARQCVERLSQSIIEPEVCVDLHLVTSEVHMQRARLCFAGIFETEEEGSSISFARTYQSSPDGARVIPSAREGHIERAMIRRLPHDIKLYRKYEVDEARRRFFTPNPEGPDGEPNPHVWLHDPYTGATIIPGEQIPPWIKDGGVDQSSFSGLGGSER